MASDDAEEQARGHAVYKVALRELAQLRSQFENVKFSGESGVEEVVESEETVAQNFGAVVMRGVRAIVPVHVNKTLVEQAANAVEAVVKNETDHEDEPVSDDDDDDDDKYEPGRPGVDNSAPLSRNVIVSEMQLLVLEMATFMQEYRDKHGASSEEDSVEDMNKYVMSRMTKGAYKAKRRGERATTHKLASQLLRERERQVFQGAAAAVA